MRTKRLALGPPPAVVALAAALVLATLLAGPAWAAAFTVNQTDDAPDADLTDSACDADATAAGDQCTLRAAVQEANDTAGDDTISFSVNTVTLSRNGVGESSAATGDLDITQNLTINGGGVVVSAASGFDDRAFEVHAPANATISNVTVQGFSNPDILNGAGGGILVNNGATLALRDSTLKSNQGNGGGIVSVGTLEVTGSTFADNTSSTSNFGFNLGGDGGGLALSGGTATVANSTFSGNRATSRIGPPGNGGGISVSSGTLSLTNVTIADNTTGIGGTGGGISNASGNPAAVQAMNTIVANNTQGSGGQCGGSSGVTSQGGNLESPADVSCPFEVQADPNLGPLANNGGPTQTRALGTGSAAIDAGINDDPTTATVECPSTDQRGVSRPRDGDGNGTATCDIGTFELDLANLSISDASLTEGDSGLQAIVFTVTLSEERIRPVRVEYATSDGTATAGEDYVSESGAVTFESGETSKEIRVFAAGDSLDEPDETFDVDLTATAGEVIVQDGQGVGTIIDDDDDDDDDAGCSTEGTPNDDNLNGDRGGAPRFDVICARAGNDTASGGRRADIILGEQGNDTLNGERGADRLYGGEGSDELNGGPGRDTLLARDGQRDVLDCGEGNNDVAVVDRENTVSNCEKIYRSR